MKKSLALTLMLALVGGLFAAAFTTSASAGSADPVVTSVDVFKFNDGKLMGKLSAHRRLCLNNATVTIYKVVDGSKNKVTTATLSTQRWADLQQATFSKRHPAMDISGRRARLRALRGTYLVKLDPAAVAAYGKSFTCLGATGKTTIG